MTALVVEDDPRMRKALCEALSHWGFAPAGADCGLQGLQSWHALAPDIVLLDLGLPDMDGLDVLQQARMLGLATPVLLLTARVTVGDCILGLNLGADDYLAKPFDLGELHARVRALVRRGRGAASATGMAGAANAQRMPCERPGALGALSWTGADGGFQHAGQPLPLSPREAALLRALLERPHCAQPKDYLLQAVFPRGHVLDDALEVVAHRLRKKLRPCGVAVMTLRGLGYLIKADPPAP